MQRTFPFMEEEVGELGPKARLFVTVYETVVKPETFKYAKWKGVGRPPAKRMPVFKAFLFKTVHDVPTTKEMIERLMLEPQSRRLCGWIWPEDVPCEAKFSKAANRKRVLSELEPDQPEPGSCLEWQAGQRLETRWPSGRTFTTLRTSVPSSALQTYPPTGCKQPAAVHNLIDGSVHTAFHLKNAFPELNPPHTYARSPFFIVNSAFRKIFA